MMYFRRALLEGCSSLINLKTYTLSEYSGSHFRNPELIHTDEGIGMFFFKLSLVVEAFLRLIFFTSTIVNDIAQTLISKIDPTSNDIL